MPLGDSSHHGPPRRPGAPPRRRLGSERPGRAGRDGPGGREPRRLREEQSPGEGPAPPAPPRPGRPASLPMLFVRYALPALVVLAGVVSMAFGTDVSLEGGAGLVSAGLAIWFVNWLFRIGATGDAERDAEDRAREYFDAHGHWPEGR